MKSKRKSYHNKQWHEFSNAVKLRDNFSCLKCDRKEPEVVLQAHHKLYVPGLEVWEYPLSDCITLCKGCHSREHGLVEPDSDWVLDSIIDLGGLDGICERNGCGTEIRYEHVTYHPNWGYKSVGSTCIEHLTRKDQAISHKVLNLVKNISNFIHKSEWQNRETKNGKPYICSPYSHHQIRIYGKENHYSYQAVVKQQGMRWYEYSDIKPARNKHLNQVKELAYIMLKGIISYDENEKELLRDIYRRIR